MHMLDHIDNISLSKDFPIKNLHALNYHADGLHYLAQSIRSEEIKIYQLNNGELGYQAVHMDNHNILMNMFNWFSLSLVNYVKLVGFIDYVTKNKLTEQDIKQGVQRREIREHSIAYAKKVIPEIVLYRNKLSAHHALSDARNDDNIMTLLSSSMNSIVYRNPYFEASFFWESDDIKPDLKPWVLTEIYEKLCIRYWPDVKLEEIPSSSIITDVYKGIKAQEEDRDAHALSFYTSTIENHIDSKDIAVQKQVAMAFINKALIFEKGLNTKQAILEYKQVVSLFNNSKDPNIQGQISIAIYNQSQVYSKMGMYEESIAMTNEYIAKYSKSDDHYILSGLGELMVAKGVRFEFLNKYQEALQGYDDVIDFFDKNPNIELRLYETQAMTNKANLFKKLAKPDEALSVCEALEEKYHSTSSVKIKSQVEQIKLIKKAILENSTNSEGLS